MLQPVNVQAVGNEIAIKWSDDSEDFYAMDKLRQFSPSAETQGERDLLGQQIGGSDRTDYSGVTATSWEQVGGYAILFHFSDGHRTGIYSYEYLKDLSKALSKIDDDQA